MATVLTLAQWNAILTQISNLGCGSLPQATAPHVWTHADIKAVQNLCTTGPTSGTYTTPNGPLWKQAIIDEINQAIAAGCCNNYYVKECICEAGSAAVLSVQRDPNVAQNIVNDLNKTDPSGMVAKGIVNYFMDTVVIKTSCLPACAKCTCHPWCYKAQYAPIVLDANVPDGQPNQLLALTSGVIVSPSCNALTEAKAAIDLFLKNQIAYWKVARPSARPVLAFQTCGPGGPAVNTQCPTGMSGTLTPYPEGTTGVCMSVHGGSC